MCQKSCSFTVRDADKVNRVEFSGKAVDLQDFWHIKKLLLLTLSIIPQMLQTDFCE